MFIPLLATAVWLILAIPGCWYFGRDLPDAIEDEQDDDDEVTAIVSFETLDIYERKVSEQGHRFDSSDAVVIGASAAQIAIFVFYTETRTTSRKTSQNSPCIGMSYRLWPSL